MQCKLPSSSLNAPISPLAGLLEFPPRGLVSFSLNYNYFFLIKFTSSDVMRKRNKIVYSLFFFCLPVFFSSCGCVFLFFFLFLIQMSVGQTGKAQCRMMKPLHSGSRLALALCFSTRGSSLPRKETAPTREVLRLSSKRRERESE